MPVLVFGDEGGVHVVAEDFLRFLQLLTYDTEISVDFEEAYFYRDEEDYEESEDQGAFREWLKAGYGLGSLENPDQVIQAAKAQHQENFDRWFAQYYSV